MSTINVDYVLPQSGNLVTVNGAGIKKTSTSVSVGPGNYFGNPPLPNQCTFLGIAAGGLGGTNRNTAVGYVALGGLTTGIGNTSVGDSSAQNVSTGSANTLIGAGAGNFITTGSSNTCLGNAAGGTLDAISSTNTMIGNGTGTLTSGFITGQGNTCIGSGASPSAAGVSFEFTLGIWVNVLRCQQTSITSLY
jgi:hypothetical protein